MNPFKEKSLEDFTIADCVSYINSYPYGERILEMKAHHRKLKSAPAKDIDNKKKETNQKPVQVVDKKPQEKPRIKKQKTKPQVSYNTQTTQYKTETTETVTQTNDDKENVLMVLYIIWV